MHHHSRRLQRVGRGSWVGSFLTFLIRGSYRIVTVSFVRGASLCVGRASVVENLGRALGRLEDRGLVLCFGGSSLQERRLVVAWRALEHPPGGQHLPTQRPPTSACAWSNWGARGACSSRASYRYGIAPACYDLSTPALGADPLVVVEPIKGGREALEKLGHGVCSVVALLSRVLRACLLACDIQTEQQQRLAEHLRG